MEPLNLQITFTDGKTAETTSTAADFIAFEAHFDKSITSLGSDVRLTYLFFLAYAAQKRTGSTTLTFEEWTDIVAAVGEAAPKELGA